MNWDFFALIFVSRHEQNTLSKMSGKQCRLQFVSWAQIDFGEKLN